MEYMGIDEYMEICGDSLNIPKRREVFLAAACPTTVRRVAEAPMFNVPGDPRGRAQRLRV